MRSRHLKRIVILLLFLLFIPMSVHADTEAEVTPKSVEQGGIELDSQRFPYEHYEPITDTSGDWNPFTSEGIEQALNALAGMLFGITKSLATLIDVALDNLYSVNIIEALSSKIDNISSSLWESLKDNFGAVLIVIAAIQIFAYYVGQRNSSKAGSATFKLMAVVMLAFIWFSNSSFFLNTLNSISNEVQGVVMSAGTFITDEEVEEGKELEGSQALMRNRSFELLVYKPYLQMNYGTTNEENILGESEEGSNRINDLLALKENEEGLKEREKIAKKEVDELDNMAMSSSNIGSKAGIAVFSIFLAILLGAPLIIISMVNLILQIVALIIAVVLPISFIISFLPSFSNSGVYTLGKLVGVFLMKVFAGLLLLFTFLLIEITQTLISTETVGLYMLNVLVTGILLILMLIKRDKIVEFITAGRVSTVDGGVARASERTKERFKEGSKVAAQKTKSTAGTTARTAANMFVKAPTKGAYKAGTHARGKMEERANARNQQQFEEKQKELGNLVDINEFKEQKKDGSNPQAQSTTGNSEKRNNAQRNNQNPSGSTKAQSQSPSNSEVAATKESNDNTQNVTRNARVSNVQPIERNNRTSQTNVEEKRANQNTSHQGSERKSNRNTNSRNANRNIEQERKEARSEQTKNPKQARTMQANNPNNTPITKWESKQQTREKERNRPNKTKVKKRAKNINRIRTKNDKNGRDERNTNN